ncbi:hypothetical protein FNV43_RR12856 [Rhamnella rubrinervis]|uniref:AAA+ ATPase domain-containing protein n=1 Tax=Rhamnella rubrinervis TaxID=2594499 RepID=A0A8K0H032_9ROSA|nr:hypothetical protein FNV43_RR12856 [Rhamnella rubrinervis]
MTPTDRFAHLGSIVGSFMFVWAIFQQFFPSRLREYLEKYFQRVLTYVYPYIQIRFNEFTGERLMRSEAYTAIENYLSSSASTQAKRLKAEVVKNNQSIVLSMDDHEEVADDFKGIKLWWTSGELIIGPYLNHVFKEGRAINVKNRQRKLYTNSGSYWSHVVFEHPANFQTLAMEPEKKKEIIDDLTTFSQAEEFYASIGRAWKRGYLLYGPPGTGKSTMVAAMANLLRYDIYDLELTAVRSNTELRRLLIETSSKSIIVIEDIDCSLDLTGQRKKKEKGKRKKKDPDEKRPKEDSDSKASQVTLSGLLNFIDGLWSACGGERIIVFTTNYMEKLDPALIRKGRMDKHIELSFCNFEAFKETNITPADVAEHLMPKTLPGDAETSLKTLIQALEQAKEEQKLKAEEDSKEEKSSDKEAKE